MTSAIAPDHERLLLDACCIINLAATSHMAQILRCLGMPIMVAVYVREYELGPSARALQRDPPVDDRIDLQPFIDEGLIQIVDLEEPGEPLTFLTLSQWRMDDGEATTGAIAIHRNWAVATDDRIGRNVLAEHAPEIRLLSTPELLHHWATYGSPSDDVLRDVLNAIQIEARYIPPRNHPLAQWWAVHR
jgi:hypothetical protein